MRALANIGPISNFDIMWLINELFFVLLLDPYDIEQRTTRFK
jgi:hypothetical protein